MKTLTQEKIDEIRRGCKTDSDRIVAFLWQMSPVWLPTHELQGRETAFGFIGSAGHARVRELARNDCRDKLKDKVERARGSDIGKDARYEYFRYREQSKPLTQEERVKIGQENVAFFGMN